MSAYRLQGWLRIVALIGLLSMIAGCGDIALEPGRYACEPNAPGTCPSGWACLLSGEAGTYRCFPTAGTSYCGNSIVETGEACDGPELNGARCSDFGFVGGQLGCEVHCEFSMVGCLGENRCGNGVREGDEICDVADLGGLDCASQGLGRGDLSCYPSCTFDWRGCTAFTCGDGLIDVLEGCDDGNLHANDGCSIDCLVETGWRCTGTPSNCVETTCGNGWIDPGELCDGANLNNATCADFGYASGVLVCNASCQLDTSGCTQSSCGNSIVETGEACDDGNTDPADGCLPNCSVEPGWICVGQPSVCVELCGNGVLDGGEQCDGPALGGQTCESLGQGYGGGTLACGVSCSFDTTACTPPTCGNGLLDPGEQCDGVLLGGQTCNTVGAYGGGILLCLGSCQYDTSSCIPIFCGDGLISVGEACDDGNNSSGDGCDALCSVEAGWSCTGDPSTCTFSCGNAVWDPGEECDAGDLHGGTCLGLGFIGGTLTCSGNCSYDTSGCQPAVCGNGVAEPGESCDVSDLDGHSCVTLGFDGGALACTSSCLFDTVQCLLVTCGDAIVSTGEACDDGNAVTGDGCDDQCLVEAGWECVGEPSTCTPLCGNGQLDSGEQCDPPLFGGAHCNSYGFDTGVLICTSGCAHDTSGCAMFVCGNGIAEPAEACDGADLRGYGCPSFGFGFGVGALTCTAGCDFDTSGCALATCGDGLPGPGETCDDGSTLTGDGCNAICQVEPGWVCQGTPSTCVVACGNGAIDADEECDGVTLGGATCLSLGYDAGTLACLSDCAFDTIGCTVASCGNDLAESVEACDGTDLRGESCTSQGYLSGALACTVSCAYDTSACVQPVCGDGVYGVGEECDDQNTQGGDGCSSTCGVESEWACTGAPSVCAAACGNGVVEAGEACDGNEFAGVTCQSIGFGGGTLGCTSSCGYDTPGCVVAQCGNGVADPTEACDASDLAGYSCVDFGFSGGLLGCASCSFDTGSCGSQVCGNGLVELGEQCDDANTSGGDGCSSTCAWENTCSPDDTITCGQTIFNVSGVSGNDVSINSCNGWATNAERVYAYTAIATGNVIADVSCHDADMDYDLYIIEGACNPVLCLDHSTSSGCDSISFPVTAGMTYYIVVEYYMNDGFNDAFDISLGCP